MCLECNLLKGYLIQKDLCHAKVLYVSIQLSLFYCVPPSSPQKEETLNLLGLKTLPSFPAFLTCTRTVKRCLSLAGLPWDPGNCQSRFSPSNPYWRRNLMTELMKVWRLWGVETMALNLTETKKRQGKASIILTHWNKNTLQPKFYFCALH